MPLDYNLNTHVPRSRTVTAAEESRCQVFAGGGLYHGRASPARDNFYLEKGRNREAKDGGAVDNLQNLGQVKWLLCRFRQRDH
jgi:hypothetical protein